MNGTAMNPRRTTLLAGMLGIVVAMALAPVAQADTVKSQVINSNGAGIGGVREVAVGVDTSVSYWIDATGSGGLSGCDAADGSPAVVTVHAPEEVTILPTELTFQDCGTQDTNTKAVTFSSMTPGTYDVTVTVQDQGGGDYGTGPATFKLRILGDSGTGPCDGVTAPATPVITSVPAGPDGQNGWFVTTPTLSSPASGAVISWSLSSTGPWTAAPPVLTDGVTTVYARAETLGSDGASCGAFSDNSRTFSVDTTAPVLNVSGSPSGSGFDVCQTPPARPTFSPVDVTSGLDGSQGDSWSVPGTASGVGTYTYNAHAKDLAGNTTTETRTYTVTYGAALNAFLQPINQDGSSRFKLGSTIPVKFTALCGGLPLSTVVAKMYVAKGDSVADPGVDEAVSTAAATTGNLFRYDPTGAQYIFNLSTKLGYLNPGATATTSFTPGTWTLKIGLDDGTWRSVNVQLVR
jgi:hypothetical protein